MSEEKKIYKCRLDEQQCTETCHGSLLLKEKCVFCTVECKPETPNFWDFADTAIMNEGSVSDERKLTRDEKEAYYDGCLRVWTAYVVEGNEKIRALESELFSLKRAFSDYIQDSRFKMDNHDKSTEEIIEQYKKK